MERDSFEDALQQAIVKHDEQLDQSTGKERVWQAIDKGKRVKRWMWYAAAVVVIAFSTVGIIGLPENKQPEKRTVKVAKPKVIEAPMGIVPISQEKNSLTVQNSKGSKIILPPQLPKDSAISALAEVEKTAAPVLPIEVAKIAVIPHLVAAIPKEEDKMPEPAFTVQFKRGKPTAKTNEENMVFTAFRRFRLKRDTSYMANAEEKQPKKMKLSFRKEN
jgi:hypothetical protein